MNVIGDKILTNISGDTQFRVSPLFYVNYNNSHHIMINQGGMSSGKTYSILQVLFVKASEKTRTITVVAESVPHLKRGAWRDAMKIYSTLPPQIKDRIVKINRGERKFMFVNGSEIEFISIPDEEKAKGAKRDIVFINEATGVSFKIFNQLYGRTNEVCYIDYNPNIPFWVHEKVLTWKDAKRIISDHRHNPFLDQRTHDKIEAYREKDKEYFDIYGRGKTGSLQGVIFKSGKNWFQTGYWPEDYTKRWFAIDFGYSNDVCALIEVRFYNSKLYVRELIYATGYLNKDIYRVCKICGAGMDKESVIIADSARPDTIAELRNMGVWIEGTKNKSIDTGLDIMKRYEIHVHSGSKGVLSEFRAYKWKYDDKKGCYMNVPVDDFNHALDALRYICLTYLFTLPRRKTGKKKVRTL